MCPDSLEALLLEICICLRMRSFTLTPVWMLNTARVLLGMFVFVCVFFSTVCVCVFFLDRGGLTNSCMLAELWVRSRKPQELYWHAPTTIITYITDNHEANNNNNEENCV